jgi:hypothetical protein
VLFLFQFNKREKGFKIFVAYQGFIIFVFLLLAFKIHCNKPVFFISHLFLIGEFILLSCCYHEILKEQYQKKIVKIAFITTSFILAIHFWNDTNLFIKINLLEVFLISFWIIVYAVFYFYNTLEFRTSFYISNMVLLVYQLGCVVFFFTGNLFFKHNTKLSLFTFDLSNVLTILMQILMFTDFIRSYKTKQKQSL